MMTAPCHASAGLPCWLEVDLDAISKNVVALQRWVTPSTALAAVVKADAYGVGATQVAAAVVQAGAPWLAVARVHEGVTLRENGLTVPILVLNRTDPTECADAVEANLTVTVDSTATGALLSQAARRRGHTAHVHLKIDTGLHRFGVTPPDAPQLATTLRTHSHLELEGLYTHFASADEADLSYTAEQFAIFMAARQELAAAGHVFAYCHAANSAATIAFPAAHLDLVRVGLLLYGISPTEVLPSGLDVRPALALRARLARISTLEIGETVGYGQTWRASRPTRVGLITAGYADGINRHLSNHGSVSLSGHRAPIIGRVSMDQTTVDLTEVPGAAVGDAVTFFGAPENDRIGLWDFAHDAATIAHEVLTGIGGRVARVYHRSGQEARVARLSGWVRDLSPA